MRAIPMETSGCLGRNQTPVGFSTVSVISLSTILLRAQAQVLLADQSQRLERLTQKRARQDQRGLKDLQHEAHQYRSQEKNQQARRSGNGAHCH